MIIKKLAVFCAALLISVAAFGQNKVSAVLIDKSNGSPISFATVSVTRKGAEKPAKYVLSNDSGQVSLEGVRGGEYTFKAELMGYKPYVKQISVSSKSLDLGEIGMDPDAQQIEAATVSAVGNPISIKKDTIEYNASSFKTTENDVLEDLLKKLPGVEVSEDGSITVNGETVKKITIDGKTFFLDDPQLASKNIPARIIKKLKVVEKKSEQAAFTGIDDGEEETVIDLSVKPGMMKGAFGSVMAGAGHDIPGNGISGDTRFQGAGFLGRFTDKSQISVILNANNTNNRGFNDLSGSMMGGMMGGGGFMGRGQGGWGNGNGITTSYMGGVNGAWDLFGDKMDLGGNYLYNHTDRNVNESSTKNTYLDDYTLNYDSDGQSIRKSGGHRFGVRLEHKFSDNTSILFEPQVNFGNGSYSQTSSTVTYRDNDSANPVNKADVNNFGDNRNVSTSGFFLLRQRLGIPGRTLTFMGRYSYSHNVMDGQNWNRTVTPDSTELVDQFFNNRQESASLMGRLTYTEPLGHNLYVEANYTANWNKSTSDKKTYDTQTREMVDAYSNNIVNESLRQDIGANLLFQKEKIRAQIGFKAIPTKTSNITSSRKEDYKDFRWNFAPQASLWGEFTENFNARMFYYGNSAQPSTSQLMPVPDNTDPLNVSFGNPSLTPYFTHNMRGDIRYNNKKTFFSFNVRFNASMVQKPIVNAIWYGADGAQYNMPFNGPASAAAGLSSFLNAPLAKSGFSISNMLRFNWSRNSSYIGSNVDMSLYPDPMTDYYGFMEEFVKTHPDMGDASDFSENRINNVGITERLRLTYRTDALELTLSGRTRMNNSTYTVGDNTTTFNNQVRATADWTWDAPGLTFKAEYNYNWYKGYSTAQPDENVFNAEIQKMLFKKKFTLSLKGYDILGQAKNLTVTDASNYHQESINNTLGRYLILSLTYRFGNMDRSRMGGGRPPRV